MSSIFSVNEITQAGLALVASATSSNPIAYVKALSASQIPQTPQDLEVENYYNGIEGEIDASSATDNVARIVAVYGNNITDTPQLVKAIAIMGKLANQSDSQAVIFAYCYDADSQIKFPALSAPDQHTRFAFNFAFDQVEAVSVTEAGSASLADLERLVSCHKAGNPNAGEDQTILGEKTFQNTMTTHDILPEDHDPSSGGYIIGDADNMYDMCFVNTGNFVNVMAGRAILDGMTTTELLCGSGGAEVRGGSLKVSEANGQEGATFNYDLYYDRVIVDTGLRAPVLESTTLTLRESNDPDSITSSVTYNAQDGFYFADNISTKYSLLLYESNRQQAGTIKYDLNNGFEVNTSIVPVDGTSVPQKNISLGDSLHIWLSVDITNAYVKSNLWVGGRISADAFRPASFTSSNSESASDIAIAKLSNGIITVNRLGVQSSSYHVDNAELGKLSVGLLPDPVPDRYEGNLTKVPIGGFVLGMPTLNWVTNSGSGRTINPGGSITVSGATNNQWMAAEWTPSTGYSGKALQTQNNYSYLEPGTYRSFSYIKTTGSETQISCHMPILLQRIA